MPAEAAPRLVDRTYRVQAKLGEGGMGAVYRATHRASGRIVALKLLRSWMTDGSGGADLLAPRLNLAREFQTLASLHHPNVIEVTDYGFDHQWGPYFAMELLQSADDLLHAGVPLPFNGKIRLLAQLLRALEYLHQRNVVHRDLKPSNVLCSNGIVKLVDFGIALTGGVAMDRFAGTPEYIAPELWHGSLPSVQSDLFAVGVITYQLLSGTMPRRKGEVGDSTSTTRTALSDGVYSSAEGSDHASRFDLVPVDELTEKVPEPFRGIVGRLLAPEPSLRYASAGDVLLHLARASGDVIAPETGAMRESFLRVPGLVGREAELARLSDGLDNAISGRGSVWLVGAESGGGKSRLMAELRTLALIQGASVTVGQAVSEVHRSFHLWLPILRAACLRVDLPDDVASVIKPLVPELPILVGNPIADPAPLPPDAARKRLFDAVASLFKMQDRTTVVLLEDLHWADEDSIKLLVGLSETVSQTRLMIVGSYRTDEAPALPATVAVANVLQLDPLTRSDCAYLAASVSRTLGDDPGVVSQLYQETEGNPFFLIERLRELTTHVRESTRDGRAWRPEVLQAKDIALAPRRRLDDVPSADRELLKAAATAGRELDLRVMETIAPGRDLAQWLRNCANAAVLEREAERWRFAHDKIRDAVLADMTPDERRQSHRMVARAIEVVYSGSQRDGKAATLAHHLSAAGDLEGAAAYHARAGDLATRLCAYGEARQQYTSALEAAGRLPKTTANNRMRVDVLLKLVYTCFVSDPPEHNFSRMADATRLLEEIGGNGDLAAEDQLRQARINSAIGRIHFYRGDVPQAIKYYRLVLPLAMASGDQELLALPACLIGTALLTQGHASEAEPLLAQAIAPLERLGEPFEWFRALGYHGASLIATGRYPEGTARLDAVLAHARQIGQASLLSAAYLMRGSSFLLSGDWPLVIENLSSVIDLAGETGDKLHMSLAWSGIGWARSHLGSVESGRTCRQRGVDIARELGGQLMLTDWYRAGDAEMALHAGELDRAIQLAEELAERSAKSNLLFSQGIAERVWGEVLAQNGQYDTADEHFGRSIAVLERGGLVLQAAWSRMRWAVRLRARNDDAAAQRLFDEAHAQFTRASASYALGELNRLRALVTEA